MFRSQIHSDPTILSDSCSDISVTQFVPQSGSYSNIWTSLTPHINSCSKSWNIQAGSASWTDETVRAGSRFLADDKSLLTHQVFSRRLISFPFDAFSVPQPMFINNSPFSAGPTRSVQIRSQHHTSLAIWQHDTHFGELICSTQVELIFQGAENLFLMPFELAVGAGRARCAALDEKGTTCTIHKQR